MSQIATTIEQSTLLLAAGIDPGSADMMWRNAALTYDFGHAMEVTTAKPILYAFNAKSADSTPAWSLSRLIDLIAETGVPMNYGPMKYSASVLDHAVNALEYQLLHADH